MKYKIGAKFSFKLKTDDFWRDVTLTDANDRYIELKSLGNTNYGGHFEVDKCDFRELPAKTVLDAVIEFKGEWPFIIGFMVIPSDDNDVSEQGKLRAAQSKYTNEYWVNVCSRNEFNALVDELASNFGKCDISYQEHCENEVIRLEGNEMKTITHEGKVIQIGAVYEFSDDGADWYIDTLKGIDYHSIGYIYHAQCGMYARIRECQAPIGTITEAPVELVDGECYQFDYGIEAAFKGTYDKKDGCFWVKDSALLTEQCTNIKPLTVD